MLWYTPGDILYQDDGSFMVRTTAVLPNNDSSGATMNARAPVRPTQWDVYPVAQGRCWEGDQRMVAVLAIRDAQTLNPMLTAGTAIAVGTLGFAGTAVACVGTVGTGCIAAGAAATAATAGLTTLVEEVANAKSLRSNVPNSFAVTVPSTTKWLDVWGTAFDPQIGTGGNI